MVEVQQISPSGDHRAQSCTTKMENYHGYRRLNGYGHFSFDLDQFNQLLRRRPRGLIARRRPLSVPHGAGGIGTWCAKNQSTATEAPRQACDLAPSLYSACLPNSKLATPTTEGEK